MRVSARYRHFWLPVLLIGVVLGPHSVSAQVLNPPYFNLAEGRNITATATCGENVPEPELYCKLVGSNWLDKPDNVHINLIQGQACDYCDPNDPNRAHPPQYAIDGTERWWQSPPLSRGAKYNEVNLTIDLAQEFNVAYVFIKMGNSPRPGVWALEKSRDYGKTYSPWQYFADTPGDCVHYFGHSSLGPIIRDDSVLCETRFSKVVPLEGGEIAVSLLNGRPSADNFSISAPLQEWSTATNIRLRLLRPKTTLGHLLSVARQDPTVTRRYFYSIKDINIGGRCVCNGHASQCDQIDPSDPYRVSCSCQHNTCGSQCEKCCSGHQQHEWRRATINDPYVCQQCNCFDHSNECLYDKEVDLKGLSLDMNGKYSGGGVCLNCQHNTEGINCHKCKPGFYRPRNKPINATDVCQPCQCDLHFSTGNCTEGTGQCECRKNFLPPLCDRCSYGYFGYPKCEECHCFPNGTYGNVCELTTGSCPCITGYTGKYCKQCAQGYYGFPKCEPCNCELSHSLSNVCDIETGQCSCVNSYGGRNCDQCDIGFYDYPRCQFCQCNPSGSNESVCDRTTGLCFCKEGYTGAKCDRCAENFFNYPNCTKCMCDEIGSYGQLCDAYGKCVCRQNFGGLKCGDCSPGFYKYPECLPCACDYRGSNGVSCDYAGRCICQDRFEGEKCDKCREGFYNFPRCEECNCNPAGLVAQFGGCDKVQEGKLCECKERVKGRICNQCKDLYWNLQITNPFGCEECLCDRNGTVSGLGICNSESGQCQCKEHVKGRICDACKDGSYGLSSANIFGCTDCQCDIGGAINPVCNKTTGNCFCKPRIKGQRCTEPIEVTYFPTFYQYQYETEDWRNPTGSPARFGYDESLFSQYSWRGYAIFNDLQKEIIANLTIQKPSIYRAIISFVNLNTETVTGSLTFTPWETFGETQQSSSIHFEPTKEPKRLYVVGKPGLIIAPMVLNPGQWEVSLKVDKNDLLVDYLVLIPQAYFDQTILRERLDEPCRLARQHMCTHYAYPHFPEESSIVRGQSAFLTDGDARTDAKLINEPELLAKLDYEGNMALLDKEQPKITMDMAINKAGTYAFIVSYHNPSFEDIQNKQSVELILESKSASGNVIKTESVRLADCPHTFVCRQIVTDRSGQISVYELESAFIQLSLQLTESTPESYRLGLDSVAAVPYPDDWSIDVLIPQFVCNKKNGQCIESAFSVIPEANKIEFEKDQNKDRISSRMPFDVKEMQRSERSQESALPQLIFLDEKEPTVDVRGTVPRRGLYTFVLHYFQPENSNFELEALIQNGLFHNGVVTIDHCPSRTGCRSVIRQRDTNATFFQVDDSFMLTLKAPERKNIWVDYILAVPVDHYDPAILEVKTEDKTSNSVAQCVKNSYYISPDDASDFCRSAIFSITVDFNGGALPCQCNTDGSYDYKCKPFGGQCNCKPNVIGRTCSRCKTGFYGFPQCKACNCPSTAVCHQVTGECICPRGVTGDQCNKCLPLTFGFDPIIGCVDCNCEPYGVQNRDLQCDVDTGQCNCKANIVGRNCNKCKPGFWSYPHCQLCRCDLRGATEDICDQSTSRCFCKENVDGDYCDQCKPDAYYLEEQNGLGCTKCFCFGTTDRCTSSNLRTVQILAMDEGWKMVSLLFTEKHMEVHPISEEHVKIEYDSAKVKAKQPKRSAETSANFIMYYSLPKQYLGNRITSYGAVLRYKLKSSVDDRSQDPTGIVAADLVLSGNNITIIHEHIEQPTIDDPFEFTTKLTEREFRHLNGHDVSREQLMMVLVRLEAIFVRATYFEPISEVYIDNVLLDKAIEGRRLADAPRALTVEQCNCPQNYRGTSCEECAPGYYRAPTGPYLGFCLPCNCNGHSNECDPVTGKCFNCQFNTEGEHCERCISGYHGDASRGTPYDCLICACPLPIASNNFGTSCELSTSGNEISCQCKEGYYGSRCDVCAAGHFGRPEVIGSTCQLCGCSGNIDFSDPTSCESTTGECLKCLHNTTGRSCEVCAAGYYGDAVQTKNCSKCSCNECGTQVCDHQSGDCRCKTNVVGKECNQCAADHWGFNSCSGCIQCNCKIGAIGTQCNDTNGQCKCRPGVTGLTCDRCEPGFWKYSQFGCTSCNCAEKYSYGAVCDQQTGQCQCLPGVVGDKCDSCPHRWVFIAQTGCQECGPCVHELLDDTDQLKVLIDPLRDEMQDTSSTVFAYRRLSHVNKSMAKSEELVEELKKNPKQFDLLPLFASTDGLNQESEAMMSKSESSLKEVAKVLVETSSVREDSAMVDGLIRTAISKSALVIESIQELEEGFQSASILVGQTIERKVSEAEWMYSEVTNKSFEVSHNNSKVELQESRLLSESIDQFKTPAFEAKAKINETEQMVVTVIKLLSELMNTSHDSLRTIVKAEEINRQTKNREFDQDINALKTGNDEIELLLNRSRALIANTSGSLAASENTMLDIKRVSEDRLVQKIEDFRSFITKSEADMSQIRPNVIKAQSHSIALNQQSKALDKMFADTRNKANDPMRAANAYNSIVISIDNSSQSAENALSSAQKASDVSDIEGLASYKKKSSELANESQKQNRQIESQLDNQLKRAVIRVNDIDNQTMTCKTNRTMVNEELRRLAQTMNLQELGQKASSAAEMADTATKKSEDSIKVLAVRIKEMEDDFRKMPEDLDEVNTAIRQSHGYINHIASAQPDLTKMEAVKSKYNQLKAMRDGYKDRITQLQRKIEQVRDAANRIKLTAEFEPDSALELHSPDSLAESATYTKLSLFFRTQEDNALLAYIGNPVGAKPRTKRQSNDGEDSDEPKLPSDTEFLSSDFMSVELDSGQVLVTWDLGDGTPASVKSDKQVNDWKWHQVIVERIGKTATVVIKTHDEEDQVLSGASTGPSSVFNLEPGNTRIFIGGIPDNVQVQTAVKNRKFRGYIEDVMLGDSPLGLWNFKKSRKVVAVKERESLVNLDSSGGLYFDGNGYAVLSTRGPRNETRINLTRETYIRLKFKTFAREGLIFLVGLERDFLALELRNGFVHFKYDLGSGPFVVVSNETHNDGKWHSISANRFEKEGAISIDGVLLAHGEAIGLSTELSTADEIYIGGYPDRHSFYEVTNTDFEGCIKELQIGTEQQNLQNLKKVLRAVPGCPSNNGRTASFSNDSTGYIAIQTDLKMNSLAQITLNFKTVSPRGLLFYVANNDHSSYLAIYLDGGILNLRVQPGGLIRSEERTYNDKQWHYITATFTPERLRLDVDDVNSFTIETMERNELSLGDSNTIFFGGIPPPIASSHPNFASDIPTSFVGCFGDATVNEKFQNFANSSDRPNASLTSCPLNDKSSNKSVDETTIAPPMPKTTETPKPLPITRRPTRPPSGQCKLSVVPPEDTSGSADTVRFGDTHWSRHEFSLSAQVVSELNDESSFEIEFRTTHEEGVIFFVTSTNNIDYVSLYLLEGKVHYAWDCGSGRALLISEQTYNDDKWHKVSFSRKGRNGQMRIDDGREEFAAASVGNTNSLNVISPLYVGGIPEELVKTAKNNLRGVDKPGSLSSSVVTSFAGCLRGLSIGANKYEFGVDSEGFEASQCSDNIESGSFFHSDGGLIRLYDEFRVGSHFSVNLEIKPRTVSGALLAVFGQTDYLALYLDNGRLTFVVDNGAGPNNVTFVPPSEHYFCDGQWHRVEANKINNVVTLNIDGQSLEPGIGIGGVSSTDTKDPLYIGGIPDQLRQSKGLVDDFVGCLRIQMMNSRRHSLSQSRVEGRVTLNTCPTL